MSKVVLVVVLVVIVLLGFVYSGSLTGNSVLGKIFGSSNKAVVNNSPVTKISLNNLGRTNQIDLSRVNGFFVARTFERRKSSGDVLGRLVGNSGAIPNDAKSYFVKSKFEGGSKGSVGVGSLVKTVSASSNNKNIFNKFKVKGGIR